MGILRSNRAASPTSGIGWYVKTALGVLPALVLAGVFAVVAVIQHGNAGQSRAVQINGLHGHGVVTLVDDRTTNDEDGHVTGYTSLITVKLDAAVRGVDQTVVHYPARAPVAEGGKLDVLVDPGDPSYAEIAGHPNTSSKDWLIWAVAAPVVLLIGLGTAVRRLLRGTGLRLR